MSGEQVLSKSARKRANQKARAAEEAAEAAEPPAPQPKSAAKAKAAPPAAEPKAKAKAKGEPKKAAAPEPKAEPKAKAKAKGEPKAAAPAPKQEPKAAAKKAAGKAKAKPEEKEEEPVKKQDGPVVYFEMDDGSRKDEWEVSTGQSKKAAKQKEKLEEKKALEKASKSGELMQAKGNQYIPGLASTAVQMAQGKAGAKAKASQAVGAVAVVLPSAAGEEAKPKAPSDNSTSVTIKIPENKIGWVVGPKGANIKLITEKCGLKTVDMSGEECTLIGPPDAVAMASNAVHQLLEKGFMSLSYEDYAEDGVMCHPTLFPDLIGKKGAIIQEIKKLAKCEVNIPAVPKNSPGAKKFRVGLAGSKASVQLGKEIINSIALYGHHELTHPGEEHKELEIDAWRYPFLIGSKGSELRHIQNNYNVKVAIPREHSANQNVVVVGEARNIERAMKYIDKILYESDQPRGRGAEDKADDGWGDDGEVEDWMKPYLYQRK